MDILNNRGTTPRIYRNMLAFIAPDHDLMASLKQEVRRYLAWKSIKDDSEDLNLDAAQNRETDNNLRRSNQTVDARMAEAYCWLLVPYIDKTVDMKIIVWDAVRISGGCETIVFKAVKKMLQNGAIITTWAPALLLMELDGVLWRESDHIAIKKLWEYLCTYCYLPRLANEMVLEDAIRNGVNSTRYFAMASAFDGAHYIDVKLSRSLDTIERSGYLVKVSVAQKQLAEEAEHKRATEAGGGGQPFVGGAGHDDVRNTGDQSGELGHQGTSPQASKHTHFYMSAPLDTTRIGRDVQKLVEEVISHLTSADGARVSVTLELNVTAPEGLSQQVVRTVSENCRTLRVPSFGFDK